jgi:hypothetical protein
MFYVSEVKTEAPKVFESELQQRIYETFADLDIHFERVDNDPAITMEDCVLINERLDMKTVKTLFLCNRQQTNFYLFVTLDGKPFVTKDFSSALGISRVSFATEELLFSMLGTKIGATTVLSSIIDTENKVRIVFDKEVLENEWYGCTDSTTTSYMKLKTSDVLEKYLPFIKHEITMIEV